jgi:hypothetical protein
MLYYESEIIAVFNLLNACKNVINSKSSIREDIRTISQIKNEDSEYMSDDTKRRNVMGLIVAISNK